MESSSHDSSLEKQGRRFSIVEIQSATHNFDDELVIGKGGFGKVYKGIVVDHETSITVAVKRLNSESKQGAREFWTEIEMLSKFRHSHLLSLIGYCNDFPEMILVYEYMPHGTLADHLYKGVRRSGIIIAPPPLSWEQRLKICIGAARGLDYLHTGTGVQHRVIHRDVKSSNILLDENFAAKISDFGLSKIGPANQLCSDVSTNVKGTFGYLDPEYFLTHRLNRKSDVYAFGVVLLEVLCGRPAVDLRLEDNQQSLVFWAQCCIREGTLDHIIDRSLVNQISPDCLKAFVEIAEKCLKNQASKRPTMTDVVSKLEFLMSSQQSVEESYILEEFVANVDKQEESSSSKENEELIHVVNHQKEIMAETTVSFTVERLGDLLISEAKLLYGVSDQVEEIKVELKRIQCFLKDADTKQGAGGDNRVRNWVADIRRLAHRTEDVIETYALVASKRNQGIRKILRKFACIVREGKALHKVGLEIQTIKGNLNSITNSLQTYGIKAFEEGESSNTKQQVLRISYPHLLERDFVGMKKDIEQVVSHLKSKDNGCEVVSIWGMGGQGKTTLATNIYNHTEVQNYFEAFAWVCITQQFQREKVLQGILKKLLPPERKEEISSMEDVELVDELYKVQKEKTCLVVIDDIWSLADWVSLSPAFPIGETTNSKILLTTRIRKVADIGILHKLQHLSDEEGLKLLLKKAFPTKKDDIPEERVKSEMEDIGRDMVRRCQGLPLAISTLGGILKGKEYREWEMINKDITSYLASGGGVEDDENRTVRGVLSLSYDNLPPRLKHSFLYLGNFKEDEIISTEELYLLWIAEGMVSLEDRAKGEMMLDVAERYLGELAQRSLVQVEQKELDDRFESYSWLKFKTCSVHDLVRDVCLSKGKEQIFLNVIDFEHHHDDLLLNLNSTSADSDLARRLCIRSLDKTTCMSSFVPFLQQQQHATQKLRSLLLFGSNKDGLRTDFPKEILSLQLLRVLKLTQIDFGNVGHAGRIGELIYLKYLSFAGDDYINEIPLSIGNLRNLQTLDLRVRTSNSITIPNVLWKLKQLQHLYLPYRLFKVNEVEKLRFDGLSELELLYNFKTSVCDANDILKLRKLQVFRGHINRSLVDLQGIISSITSRHLRYSYLYIGNYGRHFDSKLEEGVISPWILLLECPFLSGLRIDALIGVLPMGEYRFSQSLTSMELDGCKLEEDPVIILEKIPKLRYLALWSGSYTGKNIVCSAFGFPQLRILIFSSLENLVEWKVDEGAMPNLSKLIIQNCGGLKMLPDGLRFLSTLQKLHIIHMPTAFIQKLGISDEYNGVKGEDFHKVRHIPTIKISDW